MLGRHLSGARNIGRGLGIARMGHGMSVAGKGLTAAPPVQNVGNTIDLSFESATSLQITITTSDGADYTIEHPGKPAVTVPSRSAHDETFAAATTGSATVTTAPESSISQITSIAGGWSFPVTDLPKDLSFFRAQGGNSVGGDISSHFDGIPIFVVLGNNTIFGDIDGISPGSSFLLIAGNNDVTAVNPTWPESMRRVYITGLAKPQGFVDKIIETLARDVTQWTNERQVFLAGSNAPPSVAAQADMATLMARGVTVVTN